MTSHQMVSLCVVVYFLMTVSSAPSSAQEFRARVVNGTAEAGRLEIFHDGTWNTVCDDGFGQEEALVACRMLGFKSTTAAAVGSVKYGAGSGPILFSDLRCVGNEPSLAQCKHWGFYIHGCEHYEDVGVVCNTNFTARVVGGTAEAGRLEIFHDGTWNTVCGKGFGQEEALVACRMLGFNSTKAAAVVSAKYGEGSGDILFDDLQCVGNETSLAQCRHPGLYGRFCTHSEDVGVACNIRNQTTQQFTARVVNGTAEAGRLEIFYDGTWNTVCDDSFGQEEALVACRMLGFNSTTAVAVGSDKYGAGSGPILLDDLQCVGNETSLAQCRHLGLYTHNCGHGEDVGVACNTNSSAWQVWGTWSACSATCGDGTRSRQRRCSDTHGACPGEATQTDTCNITACCVPQNGQWSDWGSWTSCSVSCGQGTRTRSRTCSGPNTCGRPCEGDSSSNEYCNLSACPAWGSWSSWTCSVTCGRGTESRTRTCTPPGARCAGDASQAQECQRPECCVPRHGEWNDWGSWSSCSLSCGQGTRTRSRTCNGPNACGRPCEGNSSTVEYCNLSVCPAWGSWSSWTCSVTCGGGTMSRTRTCTPPSATCSGDASDQQECQRPACCVPQNGEWNDWGSWSSCSVSCGQGTRARSRTCYEQNSCGRPCEGNTSTEEYCNLSECPAWGSWSSWTCSVTCGRGTESRTRTCTPPGARCAGDASQEQECQRPECCVPRHGVWNDWGSWSSCSVSCGQGTRRRSRTCHGMNDCGRPCEGNNFLDEQCDLQACPEWYPPGWEWKSNDDGGQYECPKGTYQTMEDNPQCMPCPAGHFQNRTGQVSCTSCPAGHFQDRTGQVNCTSCPVDTYQESSGQPACIPCPEGEVQPVPGSTACRECPDGEFQTHDTQRAGQRICSVCQPGSYQDQPAQVSCQTCPDGTSTSNAAAKHLDDCTASPNASYTVAVVMTYTLTVECTDDKANEVKLAIVTQIRDHKGALSDVCLGVTCSNAVVNAWCHQVHSIESNVDFMYLTKYEIESSNDTADINMTSFEEKLQDKINESQIFQTISVAYATLDSLSVEKRVEGVCGPGFRFSSLLNACEAMDTPEQKVGVIVGCVIAFIAVLFLSIILFKLSRRFYPAHQLIGKGDKVIFPESQAQEMKSVSGEMLEEIPGEKIEGDHYEHIKEPESVHYDIVAST